MKLVAALLSTFALQTVFADYLSDLGSNAPTQAQVKASLSPPAGHTVFDVFYAKGNRIYQCNPEKKGFQHWYSVQTHAFLYPTQGKQAPYDQQGQEIGQLSIAPLSNNPTQSNPNDVVPVMYYYPDGSWLGSARPIATTSMEMGLAERLKAQHLDDHLVSVTKNTVDGYFSHAKYVVRLNTMDGMAPRAEECVTKGQVVNKPFTAYFLLYTDSEGLVQLAQEKVAWDQMVEEFTPK
ncbi:hypothetical protein G6F56_010425 [Rhizopus delemar]|uniref:Uncharacterized protein n=1 Tax=Rhizopus stolonifer TaxID=4846 RepID=A0A367JLX5_RHIST|nr:hypothetical protein G6F56_010425 [Rhizopus delemar]RCH90927.1 hypothetical protein CU098_010441 [Rhizopus stolonifer]